MNAVTNNDPIEKTIEKYEQGGHTLIQSVKGLTREDLLAFPVPGTWSIQQIVLHVADAEAAFADRMKRVAAEDDPVLAAWDENKFAAALLYDEQSAEDAAAGVDLTRRQLARVLRRLPAAAFERAGRHTQRGRQTLADVLRYAVAHLEHHLKFIIDKREKLGKIMW